jgi:trimeric autotransporter adhesin
MFSRLLKHRAAMGATLVVSILLATSLVGPAFGAPSPLSVAKKALKTAKKANKTAKKANKTAKSANNRSKAAVSTANSANGTARSASSAAAGANATANTALTKSGQALNAANAAAGNSGPAAIRFSSGVSVPNDGSSVEDQVSCPQGFVPVAGGVAVYDVNGDIVTSGIAVTESAIDIDGLGWFGAVQDTDNSSDRVMEVTVQCAKPSSVSASSNARRR